MTSQSLAGPGSNPVTSAAPVCPESVTWWALVGPVDLPLTLGTTPEEAEARQYVFLLRFYRDEADPPPPDPEEAARAELARWKKGALLSGTAADELSAFLAWLLICPLIDEAALAEWRAVFPATVDPDPLAELVTRGIVRRGNRPVPAAREGNGRPGGRGWKR